MRAFTVRPLAAADLAAAAAIEATAPDPWTAGQLAAELAVQRAGGAARLFVAAGAAGPLGLAAYQLAAGEASLCTFTVAPAARRQGVGRQLLLQSLAALAAQGAERCFLEARASNAPALALYEQAGFARVGLRRSFYSAPAEDAVLMAKTLLPSPRP